MGILKNRRFQLLLSALGVVLFVLVIVFVARGGEEIDAPPEEGSSLDYSNQARIIDNKDLVQKLGGVDQYDFLTKDLFVFGKKTFGKYVQEPSRVVGFAISGEPKEKDGTVSFGGRYGAGKDEIQVSVKLLNFRRIKTSITNNKTGVNIDNQLPSNSKDNQFIGGLPFSNELYKVEYNPSVNSFTITALSRDPTVRTQATEYILSGSGKQAKDLKILFKPFLF